MLAGLAILLQLFSIVQARALSRSALFRVSPQLNDVLIKIFVLYEGGGVTSLARCSSTCLNDENCLSFFYNRRQGLCQTHDIRFVSENAGNMKNNVSSLQGTKYYVIHPDEPCSPDEGYILHRPTKTCYKVHSQRMIREDGAHFCKSTGTSLMTIETEVLQVHMEKSLRLFQDTISDSGSAYIGGIKSENKWIWADGAEITKFWWADGEPDIGTYTHDCIMLQKKTKYTWNNKNCEVDRYFVCAKQL